MLGLIYFILLVLFFASLWKIFEKAGVEGWKALIPIYNMWVLAEIIGLPGWVGLLMIIPYINFIVWLYFSYLLAKSFGKDVLFALGIFILPIVFLPILAFGDSTYMGPPKKIGADDIRKNLN